MEEKNVNEELITNIEQEIKQINDEKINTENINYLSKLVDIHKDLKNENYWEEKINMRYRYGEYSEGGNYGRRGVPGTGRSRYRYGDYSDDGNYGRRGVPGTGRGRYRGEEIMDEMTEHYGNYMDGKDMYGADEETMKSFKYMLKSLKDYYKHLSQEASSEEEVEMLRNTIREMAQM